MVGTRAAALARCRLSGNERGVCRHIPDKLPDRLVAATRGTQAGAGLLPSMMQFAPRIAARVTRTAIEAR